MKLRIFPKVIFLNKFDEANTEQKFWFSGNNLFWDKPVKLEKYRQKRFSSSKWASYS